MAIEYQRMSTISSANCAPTVYVKMSVATCDGGMQNYAFTSKPEKWWLKWERADRTAGHNFPSRYTDRHARRNTQHPAIRSVIYQQSVWCPDRKRLSVRVCVQNSKKIKVTMKRTTAASGLDGWGTQHNSRLINTEYRYSPHVPIVHAVCVTERDRASERKIDSESHGGLKREGMGVGDAVGVLPHCWLRR